MLEISISQPRDPNPQTDQTPLLPLLLLSGASAVVGGLSLQVVLQPLVVVTLVGQVSAAAAAVQ
jgi:hypothetical protein